MVSKGDLGFAYLVGIGIGTFGAFTSGVLIPLNEDAFVLNVNVIFSIITGLIVTVGFLVAGFGLARSDLSDERIWHVASWSAVGLGIPSIATLILLRFGTISLTGFDWRSVAILNIAGGGIVGILFGAIMELRAEHRQTKTLHERNTVFLRLFRHDIRNSLGAIVGHIDLIDAETDAPKQSIEVIHDHINRILELSDAARRIDEVSLADETEPIELVDVLRAQIERIEHSYPEVDIRLDVPSTAYIQGDDLLQSVVENLLMNAVEHHEGTPTIRVSIQPPRPTEQFVTLRIEDDGPGFTEDELEIHSGASETALQHSSGIGIWLSRWIVDSYGGELSITNADSGGAIVDVEFPRADVERSPPT